MTFTLTLYNTYLSSRYWAPSLFVLLFIVCCLSPHKHTPWDQELLAPSTRMSTQEAHRKYLLAKWINEELEKELGRVLDRESGVRGCEFETTSAAG